MKCFQCFPILFLTFLAAFPLSGAVQYDAVPAVAEFLSEKPDASRAEKNDAPFSAPDRRIDDVLPQDFDLFDWPALPSRGQPLPGVLLTALTGVILSGRLNRLFSRKRIMESGAGFSREESFRFRAYVFSAFDRVRYCRGEQKIVLRL